MPLLSSLRPAAPAQPEQPIPIFRADINFVRVDVIVSDRQGNPVHDLTQEDFEVTEDGKPQVIQTFKLINITENAGVGQRSAAPDPQCNRRADGGGARRRAVVCGLPGRLSRAAGEQHARARSDRAVCRESAAAGRHGGGHVPALVDQRRAAGAGTERNCRERDPRVPGRKYDYTPRNLFEERYVHYVSTIEAERIRNQVTLTAIKGSDRPSRRAAGGAESRSSSSPKASPTSLPAQVTGQIATCNGGACGNQPRPRPDPISPARRGSSDSRRRSFSCRPICCAISAASTELANRYNTTIYTVDPRGLAPFEFDLEHAGLGEGQPDEGPRDAREHDGHAAHPCRRNRRPRHRQQQRSRHRAAADRPRLERVLPAGLHLDAVHSPTESSTRSTSGSSGRACRCGRGPDISR